jgi:hypothetical protein
MPSSKEYSEKRKASWGNSHPGQAGTKRPTVKTRNGYRIFADRAAERQRPPIQLKTGAMLSGIRDFYLFTFFENFYLAFAVFARS